MGFCEQCGTPLSSSAKFCRSCGNEVVETKVAAAQGRVGVSSQLKPITNLNFVRRDCTNCGHTFSGPPNTSIECPNCAFWVSVTSGTTPSSLISTKKKHKTTSVILAIFLGPLSWLYSYSIDSKKFWYSVLAIVVVAVLETLISPVFSVLNFLIWLWSLVDAFTKPSAF